MIVLAKQLRTLSELSIKMIAALENVTLLGTGDIL